MNFRLGPNPLFLWMGSNQMTSPLLSKPTRVPSLICAPGASISFKEPAALAVSPNSQVPNSNFDEAFNMSFFIICNLYNYSLSKHLASR